jgi:tRNA(Ile2)-agmatinylcytidine synthase
MDMRIGIDDTDSPQGMCTTYLGAVLARRLIAGNMQVRGAHLVRLNPNVTHKTRGNAAIALIVDGDLARAFAIANAAVEELADFSCENTNPGVVVSEGPLDPSFYRKAVTDFCTIEEVVGFLESSGAMFRGYKNRRGLIGAAAAIACPLEDSTWEVLVYRQKQRWGTPRQVDRESLFAAEAATFPHTWDTVDRSNDVVVCVPHTPDPVLFGIRGESPAWVMRARQRILSEPADIEQLWATNQGTDAHLLAGIIGNLLEGRSYHVRGVVSEKATTGVGGHVSFTIRDGNHTLRCMAYEPTKGFRNTVRALVSGDEVVAAGSYKKGSINLEKLKVVSLAESAKVRPPVCSSCGKRMTSDGRGKGYKCRDCKTRAQEPERTQLQREIREGWYEVPPTARRHLARPLCRGEPDL